MHGLLNMLGVGKKCALCGKPVKGSGVTTNGKTYCCEADAKKAKNKKVVAKGKTCEFC